MKGRGFQVPTNSPTPDQILEAMRDYKCDVKVLDSPQTLGHQSGKTWKTTGFDNWGGEGGLIGAMMHHTTGPVPTKTNPIPGLNWFKNASDPETGTPWPGAPACNQIIGAYPGNNLILCGRVAMHSGSGSDGNGLGITANRANFRLWGIEMASPGKVKDLNDYQLEQAFRSLAALADLCGWPQDGKTIINHKDWAPTRKNDTLYSRNFWSGGMKKYLNPGTTSGSGGNGGSSEETESNIPAIELITKVGKSAIGKSEVMGTPQEGRFAIMNLTNETVFISDGDLNVIDRSNSGLLYVNANAIEEGDKLELKRSTGVKNATNQITIESSWVQDSDTANSVLNLISDSLNTHYIRLVVQVFGNPLVQVGDIVQVFSKVYKLDLGSSDYFIVNKVNHGFSSTGLTTSLELRPIKETLKMI